MSLFTEKGSIGIGFATLLGPVMAVARRETCTSAEVLLVRTLEEESNEKFYGSRYYTDVLLTEGAPSTPCPSPCPG